MPSTPAQGGEKTYELKRKDVLEDFERFLRVREDLHEKTAQEHAYMAGKFLDYCQEVLPEKERAREFKEKIMNEDYSKSHINNAVLKAFGVEVNEEEKEKEFAPRKCIRCGTSNPHDSERCRNCGMLLDGSKVTEEPISKDKLESELMNMIEKDPDKWGSVFLRALEKSKSEVADS